MLRVYDFRAIADPLSDIFMHSEIEFFIIYNCVIYVAIFPQIARNHEQFGSRTPHTALMLNKNFTYTTSADVFSVAPAAYTD